MRKALLFLITLLASAFGLSAQKQEVRDLDIQIKLSEKGSAIFDERWDINTGPSITEWYLVRENLGDIIIPGFTVVDGDKNSKLEDVGEWDINKSFEEKAGKSGIVHKDEGVELCWGIAPRGDRVFYAIYSMVKAMKSLNDYDMLHLQVVSPGMSSPPQHVKVTVRAMDFQLDTTNTRAWGFGFQGTTTFTDSTIVFESSRPFRTNDSAIILLRFNKGLFQPLSVQERDFQEALDVALEKAKFADDPEEDEPWVDALAGFFTLLFSYLLFIRPIIKFFKGGSSKVSNKDKRKLLGINPKDIEWHRGIPLDGSLQSADYVLRRLGERGSAANLPLAEILRMIYRGNLTVTSELQGPVNIAFSPKGMEGLSAISGSLYTMLKEAAGEDNTLQDKEFSKWASKHESKVYNWSNKSNSEGVSQFRAKGLMKNDKFTDAGKAAARELMGLKKFLNEFTLVSQRETVEANLWKEYLVYAALFGIADKVANNSRTLILSSLSVHSVTTTALSRPCSPTVSPYPVTWATPLPALPVPFTIQVADQAVAEAVIPVAAVAVMVATHHPAVAVVTAVEAAVAADASSGTACRPEGWRKCYRWC